MPSATVTFLFTDIEGSTQLWERHPQAMQAALGRHDALLTQAITHHGGTVVKRTGDGCHAVFAAAADGALATLDAQQALAAEPWSQISPDRLRVRMALHTGEAEVRDGDYYGPALNRAARLMAAGHGGQVLLSQMTAGLVRDQLPPGLQLRDLGEHRLKDLTRAEHVFQLGAPGLPGDFPPLHALGVAAHNLPVQLTSFIGRERELAEAKRLLGSSRLLTLTGPGGTGKTRLSLQVAAEVLEAFADGVWLVELAPLSDPALVPAMVAAVWGVREQPGRTLTDALIDYLRAKTLLLILDNCEHLIVACAELAATLLSACPKLKMLPSSREALGIAGEIAYRVPSLSVPDDQCTTPLSLLQFDAARLFVERAQAAQPRFTPSAHNLSAIVQICQRLDGIPLAIELAAARVRLLTVEQIAARLDDRFRLLTGGSRTALPRQQTLRALIDWSYDLLLGPEQAALRQLAVFAGGWTLEAAEAVVGAEALDLLGHLADRSLVVVEEDSSAARYRLLETIRQYAREKLFEAHESESARKRHLDYYLAWVEIVEPKLFGPAMIAGLDQLEVEQDNVRAALEWALENDGQAALRLAAMLYMFWGRRASATEGLKWVKTALARSEAAPRVEGKAAQSDLLATAKALEGEAALAFGLGDNLTARTAIEASISLARQINATRTLALALGMGATICGMLGEVATARAWAEECLALCRQYGYTSELGMVASVYLFVAVAANEPVPLSLPEETLRTARATGNPWVIAMAIQNLARVAAMSGNLPEAYSRFEEAATLGRHMRDRSFYNSSRSEMGHILRKQGRQREAVAIYRVTIPVWHELGQRAAVAHELESLGFMAGADGQYERSAKVLGAAEALREFVRSPMTAIERREYEPVLSNLRGHLPESEWAAAWAAGRAMGMDQAIEYALG